MSFSNDQFNLKIADFESKFKLNDDINKEILSYFHSSYKKPNHYVALLDQDDFYFLRKINKERSPSRMSYYCNGNFYDTKNISYYFKILINTEKNTTLQNILRFKNRGVANIKIIDDFIKIFDYYEENNKKFYLNSVNLTYCQQ